MEKKPFYRQLLEDAIADAKIEALRKAQKNLLESAERIEHHLYTSEGYTIYCYARAPRCEKMHNLRNTLRIRQNALYTVCGEIGKQIKEFMK